MLIFIAGAFQLQFICIWLFIIINEVDDVFEIRNIVYCLPRSYVRFPNKALSIPNFKGLKNILCWALRMMHNIHYITLGTKNFLEHQPNLSYLYNGSIKLQNRIRTFNNGSLSFYTRLRVLNYIPFATYFIGTLNLNFRCILKFCEPSGLYSRRKLIQLNRIIYVGRNVSELKFA